MTPPLSFHSIFKEHSTLVMNCCPIMRANSVVKLNGQNQCTKPVHDETVRYRKAPSKNTVGHFIMTKVAFPHSRPLNTRQKIRNNLFQQIKKFTKLFFVVNKRTTTIPECSANQLDFSFQRPFLHALLNCLIQIPLSCPPSIRRSVCQSKHRIPEHKTVYVPTVIMESG